MRGLPVLIASFCQVVALGTACAHGDHKPKHDGIMGRGDDEVSIELVMEKGIAILYMEHESGKPIQTERIRGTLSLAGPGRPSQEAKLSPAGDDKMTASGLKPVAGDRLRVHMIFPNGAELSSIFSFR